MRISANEKLLQDKNLQRFKSLILFLKHWIDYLPADFYDRATGGAGVMNRMITRPDFDDSLTEQDAKLILQTLRDLAEHAEVVANELEIRILNKEYSGRQLFRQKLMKHYREPGGLNLVLAAQDFASYQNYCNQHRFNIPFEGRSQPSIEKSTLNLVVWKNIRRMRQLEPSELYKELTSITQTVTAKKESVEIPWEDF
jgi:hypothetical protein